MQGESIKETQVVEEELKKSAMLPNADAEYDTPVEASTTDAMIPEKPENGEVDGKEAGDDGDIELSDQEPSDEELDEDAEGEEDNDFLLPQEMAVDGAPGPETSPVDEEGDVDASGEEDDQVEGVGAVKMEPGDSDDEEEEEEDGQSDDSSLPSAPEDESDEEAAWEEAEGAGEEDEDSEVAPSNTCMFCKQDEENDPSEDFESFLACAGCGDNGMTPDHSWRNETNESSPSTMRPRCFGNERR